MCSGSSLENGVLQPFLLSSSSCIAHVLMLSPFCSLSLRRGGLSDLFRVGPTTITYLCILSPRASVHSPHYSSEGEASLSKVGIYFCLWGKHGSLEGSLLLHRFLSCMLLARLTEPDTSPLHPYDVGLESDYRAVTYHQNREADIAHVGTSGFSYGSFILFYIG